MEAKEEIRSKLNIEDVVGKYVVLKRAGRNFKGLSPFSQEKTPSFIVSPDKNIWHDFSSGRGGDIFSFIMEIEGLDFRGALELLGRQAGVEIKDFGDKGLGKKKNRLHEALELATKYYQKSLASNKSALEYVIKKRGLSPKIANDFRLGYAPGSGRALVDFLAKRGFSREEIKDAGLGVDRRHGFGDMFTSRMMVPLTDPQGKVVGFTARIIEDNPKAPKYINTPQTLLYDKSRNVFGLSLAKDSIRQKDFVVITEGQLDVITSHQFGVENVVATAGTAMTENHLRILSRFTQNIRLAFDADKAGVAATERALELAGPMDIILEIVSMPQGEESKDPDELIRSDVSKWEEAITKPKDAVEWLLDKYAVIYDITTGKGKEIVTRKVFELLSKITNEVMLEHYNKYAIKNIGLKTGASAQALADELEKYRSENSSKPTNAKTKLVEPDKYKYQDHFLALNLAYPQLRDSMLNVDPTDFQGEIRQKIAEKIKKNSKELQSDEINVKINELSLIVDSKYPNLSDELFYDTASMAKTIRRESMREQLTRLKQQFTLEDDIKKQQELNKQISQLEKEIESLKR